jgi:uncharacterized damage-inducible protein DinB
VAEDIPADRYEFAAAPGTRTVARTLVHIAVVPRLQLHLHRDLRLRTLDGFDFFGYFGALHAEEQKPWTKEAVLDLLRTSGAEFAGWAGGLSDDFLAERVGYPAGMDPATKSRFEMIIGAKEHEMHHRGQLMLVERMLGITPHLTRQMMARVEEMQRQNTTA